MDLSKIQHKFVQVRGLKLHIAEIGSGPNVVIFLHGFPEIWYSWRYQMLALADAGFRAIAPDFRGYGLSEQPPEPEKASFDDLDKDLLAMIDCLGIDKVFLNGKDFGARVAYMFAVQHPERLSGVISLGVPFIVPGAFQVDLLPKGFYLLRWMEPGRAEADFGRFDIMTIVRNIYILFSGSELPIANDDQEIMDLVEPSTPLPAWFRIEDLQAYASLYEKSGFRFPLQVPYRSWMQKWDTVDPKVMAPTLLIMGEKDYSQKFTGLKDYVKSGKVKDYVADLKTIFLPEGSHFVQEQFPDEVNQLILEFLKKHT